MSIFSVSQHHSDRQDFPLFFGAQGTTSNGDNNGDGQPQRQQIALAGQKRSGEPYHHQACGPPSRRSFYTTSTEREYGQAAPTPSAAAATDTTPWEIVRFVNLEQQQQQQQQQQQRDKPIVRGDGAAGLGTIVHSTDLTFIEDFPLVDGGGDSAAPPPPVGSADDGGGGGGGAAGAGGHGGGGMAEHGGGGSRW